MEIAVETASRDDNAEQRTPTAYSIEIEGKPEDAHVFTVLTNEQRSRIMSPIDQLLASREGNRDEFYVTAATTHLLGIQQREGDGPVFVDDALDLIDELPEERLTPHLRSLKQNLAQLLYGTLMPSTADWSIHVRRLIETAS